MSYVEIKKQFGVEESTIRYWAKNGIKEDQRKNNGKAPVYHELETQLFEELLKT